MICIFDQFETDFSGNGIGPLCPTSCEVSETLNGEYELKMEHPIDAYGKWLRIQSGRILRVPVPAAMTPQVHLVSQTATDIYKTNGNSRPLRAAASAGSKKLAKYKKNKEVIKNAQPVSGWYEVIGPDGKRGYMQTGHLTFVRTDYSLAEATGEVVEPTQMRDQPFRIYRIVPELDRITVHARHIFYDLRDNMIKSYVPDRAQSGAAVVEGISAACLTAHEFKFYSDIDTVPDPEALEDDKAIEFTNVNPIDALLGDDGFIPLYGGELARDWFDVYMVKRVGVDSGVQIREGKNLLGISYDETDTDVITRIMPTGEDKDGELLYLPELYVDSPNIEAYANPKWHHLPVSDCKENPKKTADNPKKTKEQCYAQMREEAQKQFDSGCDLPTVTLNVDFVNCAETEEYRQYAYLQNIYLGDSVRVITKKTGIRVTLRMTEYTFDCLTRKYTKMTLGTIADGLEANTISPRQIPAGSITGSKIAINSVGVGQMQEGSVGSAQIQDAAIGNAHIQNAAIKSANIDTAAILYAHIAEAAVNQIKAGSLEATTAKIESLRAGDIVTDRLAAALAAFTVVTAGNAEFNAATIGHLVSNFFNLDGSGTFDDVYIHNLVLTYAQIAAAIVEELALKGTDGHYYRITVANGQLSPVLIPDSEIDEQTGMTTDGTRSLIDSALSQLDMTSGPTIKGIVGVINRIYASVIDADALFAREAIIAKLRTTQIVGDKTITMIAADAANAGNIWRGTEFPTDGVKTGKDLFVKTDTNEVYQATDIEGFGGFYYEPDTGVLYYDAPEDAPYRIWLDDDGVLQTEGIHIAVDDAGEYTAYGWALVRDQHIVDMATAAASAAESAQDTADDAAATANNAASAASVITQRINPILQAVQVQSDGLYIRAVSLDPVTGEYVIVPDAYYNKLVNIGYELKSPTATYPDLKIRPRKQIFGGRVYFQTSDGGVAERSVMPSDYDD